MSELYEWWCTDCIHRHFVKGAFVCALDKDKVAIKMPEGYICFGFMKMGGDSDV